MYNNLKSKQVIPNISIYIYMYYIPRPKIYEKRK